MNAHTQIKLGSIVKLTPNGPTGRVLRFPRKHVGEPPLVIVEWSTGRTNLHDRRDLTLVS